MTRNQIKIVSDSERSTLAFYIRNERGEWHPVANVSELSRSKYCNSNIEDHTKEIIEIISSPKKYNRAERGVDIVFEGEDEDFALLQKTIDAGFSEKNITCRIQKTKVAVAGKSGSRKTDVIKAIANYKHIDIRCTNENGIEEYADNKSGIVFYEIPGMQIGDGSLSFAENYFDNLADAGLSALIYCFGVKKYENAEVDYIRRVKKLYPDISILIVLTQSYEEENEIERVVDEFSREFDPIRVIPVLEKDKTIKTGSVIPAFGIEDINRFVFEGK